jgi:clan AA aspartic protease (TIGR02281 family)
MAGLLKSGVYSAACFTVVSVSAMSVPALSVSALFASAAFASALWAAPPGSEKETASEKDAGSEKGKSSKAGAINEAERAPRAKLSEKGVRVSHSGLALLDEKELGSAFNRANTFRRKLVSASKELQSYQQGIEDMQDNLRERLRANVELNSQLARGARSNQLVGEVNANASAINLLIHDQERSKKEIDEVRKRANDARESYVQEIAEVRTVVDRMSARYAALKADADAQNALAEWNAAANTAFEFKPSPYFLNSVKRLEALEKSVVSEKIPLRREGNSYYATVTINGKQTEDMIVDTGANSIVLPFKVAAECGITPDDSAVTVVATVADGSKVKSKQVLLDSVKVGQFTAERVEAIILPPEAKHAPMLLGMTFLSRFNFSINGTELSLSKIDAEQTTAKPKKSHASKSPRKSKKSKPPTDPSAG